MTVETAYCQLHIIFLRNPESKSLIPAGNTFLVDPFAEIRNHIPLSLTKAAASKR